MHVATFAVEAEVEGSHWWFVGRRRLFAAELERAGVKRTDRVLEIGTGTGANLRMLRRLGFKDVTGVDTSDEAIGYCASKGLGTVHKADICALPVADESVDVVLATDVLEHVNDDALAAREIARVLVPGGKALITVPAFPSLWGLQDRQAFHKRRYRLNPLLTLLRSNGLSPWRYYHFNYLLFVPIYITRRLLDLCKSELKSENQINSQLINRLLRVIFTIDVVTAGVLKPPFGVSIIALASKPTSVPAVLTRRS
jgi:SAM-dependent methyltransferase